MALCVGLTVVAVGTYVALDQLRFPLRKDELHYWPATLLFSRPFPPSADLLREYPELSTPLTFVLFGALNHLLGWGYVAARRVTLALGIACALIVGTRSRADSWRGPLAATGLLLYPYFLFASTHYYPDMLAAALALTGVLSLSRGRCVLAGCWFALAVSTRQYMVALPLAAAGVGFARDPILRRLLTPSVWGPALAVAVLGAWFLSFGGYAPATAVEWQAIRTVRPSIVLPQNSLYLLACIGAFYVLPEMALLRRPLRHALTPGHTAAWDKYALPVLLVVWCIAAASEPPAATVMPSPPSHEPGRSTPPLRRQTRLRTFGAFPWPD